MSDKVEFFKFQGAGNDFVLIDELAKKHYFTREQIVKLCDRHFGIGADGLVLVRSSESADFKMAFYNPDGSEAEMCGNGIRCLTKYVYDHGLTSKENLVVETLAGNKELFLSVQDGKVENVKVDMGSPVFVRTAIPMLGGEGEAIGEPLRIEQTMLQVTCLSMGNPHCVIFVKDTSNTSVTKIGSLVECLPIFPQRTNVGFAQVITRKEIDLRVWERGVGETLACGTGACAAVAASVRNRLTQRKVIVHLPGGDFKVEWADNDHMYLMGPAEEVFSGSISL